MVARPHRGDRHVNSQDQNPVFRRRRPCDQLIYEIIRLVGVELKPGVTFGEFIDLLQGH